MIYYAYILFNILAEWGKEENDDNEKEWEVPGKRTTNRSGKS
jgi:hypothetical protein